MQVHQLNLQACMDFNNYIMQVEDLINLLGPYPTNELLPDLFHQFKTINCHYFHKALLDLEQDYYLGQATDLTCFSLCTNITAIKQIQEQVQQWDALSLDNPTILTLQTTITNQHSALLAQQQVLKTLTQESPCHYPNCPTHGSNKDTHDRHNLPKWV